MESKILTGGEDTNNTEILTGGEDTNNTEILTSIEDSNKFYKVYDKQQNTISNILNKYERTKVIFERYQMIANGSKPFISNPEKYDDIYDIVLEELKQKKIPFIIKRYIDGKYEYLKLQDFVVL
jgi:DNA-directed RNA polymerase subunit K/omega